ncbi:uncharacterized protein [Temnothorax longispinosus]|uniref:uncharacterized protein isoform X1 n=2 Tax=Temnothorax longispinosus TaxID=300112 RepID=UPI003A98E759
MINQRAPRSISRLRFRPSRTFPVEKNDRGTLVLHVSEASSLGLTQHSQPICARHRRPIIQVRQCPERQYSPRVIIELIQKARTESLLSNRVRARSLPREQDFLDRKISVVRASNRCSARSPSRVCGRVLTPQDFRAIRTTTVSVKCDKRSRCKLIAENNLLNRKTPFKRMDSKKWSVEEVKHLILAVQHRRALWDISQPVDQRSKETRKRLWEEVADELNGVLDAITVKQKFKSLRNTYRKIVQSEQYLPSGSGRNKNEGRHKWKHYDRMEFLRDTSLSKDTSSNISSTKNELLNKSVDQSTSQVQNPIDIDPNDSSSTESETETPTLSSTFTSGKKPKTQYQFYY